MEKVGYCLKVTCFDNNFARSFKQNEADLVLLYVTHAINISPEHGIVPKLFHYTVGQMEITGHLYFVFTK